MEYIDSHDDSFASPGTRPASTGISRILLCLDRSELSESILSYAVMLTRAVAGSLTLMHVMESSSDSNSNSHDALMWELKRREVRQYMEQVQERISRLDVIVNIQIAEGKAAEQILGFIRNNPVDYVILASHGIYGRAEWSLSSTAAKVIGRTHSSFIIVPTTPTHQHAELQPCIQRILVPLDDSLTSQTSLPIAIRIARQQNAELILLHAIESASFNHFSGIRHADRKVVDTAASILASVARKYFDQVVTRLQNEGLNVSIVVRPSSNPIELITETIASMNIDFVAMSAHGSTGSVEYPLARTSTHMAAHTPVPLLVEQDLTKEQISRALKSRLDERAPLRCNRSTGDETN